jgi:hypothetical protein
MAVNSFPYLKLYIENQTNTEIDIEIKHELTGSQGEIA